MNQRLHGVHFLMFSFALLVGCAAYGAQEAMPREPVNVSGTVEKICAGCDTADLVNGGAVVWDVVIVRVTSPEVLSGTTITVRVLLEGDGVAQREKVYPLSSSIGFVATKAAIDARKVMLHLSDISAAN